MKKYLFALALLAVAACGSPKEQDPYKAALIEKIKTMTDAKARIGITSFELVKETTYGQELEHRVTVMTSKLDKDTKFFNSYTDSNMKVNAAKKKAAMERDEEILAGLAKIGESLGDLAGQVAYRDYKFSGIARAKDGDTEFKDYYAVIAADGTILAIEPSLKGLHKALGRVLPGYTELITGEEESE